jgi:hypothetical protein
VGPQRILALEKKREKNYNKKKLTMRSVGYVVGVGEEKCIHHELPILL